MGVFRRVVKPRSKKSHRALAAREPKAFEYVKKALIIRCGKSSQTIREVLKDIHSLKKPFAESYSKSTCDAEIRPFENSVPLETLSTKLDSSLFLLGNKTKKRPDNLTFARTFDGKILDMIELGVGNYSPISSFEAAYRTPLGTKPCLIFSGPLFTSDPDLARCKSLFIDFFRGPVVSKLRLSGVEHVISFTATPDRKVLFRSYKINLKKSGTKIPRIELNEMGPSIDFTLRRTHLASDDLFKTALKTVKNINKVKKVKNISKDDLENTYGRVHVSSQEISKIQTRKIKGLKPTKEEKEALREKEKKIIGAKKAVVHQKNVEEVFMETD